MRFQVPQFIETEEPIIGPLDLKQFFWVAGGGAILFILFLAFGPVATVIIGLPLAVLVLAMAFIKIKGTPLPVYTYHMVSYIFGNKKYIYKSDKDLDIYGTE